MSFKCKALQYVFILVAMGLGGTESSIQAMKRVHEAEGVMAGPISDFSEDPLRTIFAMVNKATIVQVCKVWHTVANFKENWGKFCDIATEELVLDCRDYIRMYYLLLENNDIIRMERLLSIDPYKAFNLEVLARCLMKEPAAIAQSPEMRALLVNNQLGLKKNAVDETPAKDSIELNGILLRNDDQALQQFIEEKKDTTASPYGIACFGTHQAIERLLAHWKKVHYNDTEFIPYDEVLGHLMTDYGGGLTHIFNIPCRISILELLLKSGASLNGGEDTARPISAALYQQDYQALKLLCEYGDDVNEPEACCCWLDESGLIHQGWEEHTGSSFLLSPLMYCIYIKAPRFVALLLKNGADAFEVNRTMGDALEFAKKLGNQQIVDLIKVARAVEKKTLAGIKARKSVDADSE